MDVLYAGPAIQPQRKARPAAPSTTLQPGVPHVREHSARRQCQARGSQQIDATGAATVAVSCASCRLNFMAGAEQDAWPTRIESVVELVAAQLPGTTQAP